MISAGLPARLFMIRYGFTMLWVAAFLSLVIWVLGWSSGFLGLRIHLFLFFALLAVLAALLPARTTATEQAEAPQPPGDELHASSVPADDGVGGGP
jgi:hypothetical protein